MSSVIFENDSVKQGEEVKTVDSPAELVEELEKKGLVN